MPRWKEDKKIDPIAIFLELSHEIAHPGDRQDIIVPAAHQAIYCLMQLLRYIIADDLSCLDRYMCSPVLHDPLRTQIHFPQEKRPFFRRTIRGMTVQKSFPVKIDQYTSKIKDNIFNHNRFLQWGQTPLQNCYMFISSAALSSSSFVT